MTPRKLSPSAALALAVLRGTAAYPEPVRVVRGRNGFNPTVRRVPRAERLVALRAKDGGKT